MQNFQEWKRNTLLTKKNPNIWLSLFIRNTPSSFALMSRSFLFLIFSLRFQLDLFPYRFSPTSLRPSTLRCNMNSLHLITIFHSYLFTFSFFPLSYSFSVRSLFSFLSFHARVSFLSFILTHLLFLLSPIPSFIYLVWFPPFSLHNSFLSLVSVLICMYIISLLWTLLSEISRLFSPFLQSHLHQLGQLVLTSPDSQI